MSPVATPEEGDQPAEVQAIIALVRGMLPEMRWTRWQPYNQTEDDRIWWFWLPGQDGHVQLEPGFPNVQFDLNTDKQADSANADSPDEAAKIIVTWLSLPGGAPTSFWYSR